jgi:uncharacterized protein involved in exopolysaccharide biosynthesis
MRELEWRATNNGEKRSEDSAMEKQSTVGEVLTVVFKRKWTILLVFLLFLLSIAIGNSRTPVSYESTAKLLIHKTRGELMLTPADIRSAGFQAGQPEDLNAEAGIIKNRELLERTVFRIGPERLEDGVPGKARPTFGRLLQPTALANGYLHFLAPPNANGHALSPTERAVLQLNEDVKIVPVQASNLILIQYRHSDPVVAADVVNTIVQGYLDLSLKLKQRSGAYEIFAQQSLRSGERLAELERALAQFDQTAGVVSPQTQRDVGLGRLADLDSVTRMTRAELAHAKARVESITSAMALTPTRVETVQEMHWNAAVDDFKKRLTELEVERVKLLSRYTEQHRTVGENAGQIVKLREWLRREAELVPGTSRTDVNPTSQALERDLSEAQAVLRGLTAKEQVLTAELQEFRQGLARFHANGAVRDQLVREIKAAEDAYFLYKRKTEEARVDSVLDEGRISNVKVAEWAKPGLEPTGIRRGLLLAMGSAVGLLGGTAVAFVRESLDRRVSTPRDVGRHLGLTALASIPRKNGL